MYLRYSVFCSESGRNKRKWCYIPDDSQCGDKKMEDYIPQRKDKSFRSWNACDLPIELRCIGKSTTEKYCIYSVQDHSIKMQCK